jgi:hypothetical protein
LRRGNVPEGEYLAYLSVKHSLDPEKLFQALASTRDQQRIMCGCLSIECRGRSRNGWIFLMMNGAKVVAQVKISDEFFVQGTNPIGRFSDCERVRRYLTKQAEGGSKVNEINGLRVGMSNINLNAKILEVHEPKSIHTRFGNQGLVANALIGDKTGTVNLTLWGEQIGAVSVGDIVQISNARMLTFKGEKQLQIGRNGTLKVERESASIPRVKGLHKSQLYLGE